MPYKYLIYLFSSLLLALLGAGAFEWWRRKKRKPAETVGVEQVPENEPEEAVHKYHQWLWFAAIVPFLTMVFFGAILYVDKTRLSGEQEPAPEKREELSIVVPEEYSVYGIDVSHHNGKIDWSLVAKYPVVGDRKLNFAYIKATEGGDHTDRNFAENWQKCKEAGIRRGAYHFFSPYKDAKEQAAHFIANVKLDTNDLAPVLDVEKRGLLSKKKLRKRVQIWLDSIEKHYGVKPILYTGNKFYHDYLHTDSSDYRLWIAHYGAADISVAKEWELWQISEKSKISGIKGFVDFNVYNGKNQRFDSAFVYVPPAKNN